jgi:hypothetical protein
MKPGRCNKELAEEKIPVGNVKGCSPGATVIAVDNIFTLAIVRL